MSTQLQRVTDEPETTPTKTRITRVTVGRVHNWGNYENKRFEVSAEIGASDDPAKVILEIEAALDALSKTETSLFSVESARKMLAKPLGELKDYEIENLPQYRATLARAEGLERKRTDALNTLSQFGGISQEHRDAKDSWDEDDRY